MGLGVGGFGGETAENKVFSNVPVVGDETVGVQPNPEQVPMPTGAVVRLIGTILPAIAPPSVAKAKPMIETIRSMIKFPSAGSVPGYILILQCLTL